MSKKKKEKSDKHRIWIDAQKKYHLSPVQIQMARELGMNPKKFGKLANYKQEPWKLPLPIYIEELYFERFKRERPENMRSIKQKGKVGNKNKNKIKSEKSDNIDFLPF